MAPTRRAYDKYVPWTPEEDEKLRQLVERYGSARDKCSRWSEHLPGRTAKNCRKRWFYSLDPSIKKSTPWTNEEDARLRDLVAAHGQTWCRIARDMDGRTDDQCAARFVNVLSVTDRPWSPEEDERLLSLQADLGNKWKEIAASFEGRSPLSCRNRCRKFLRSSSKSRSVTSRAPGGSGSGSAPASASESTPGSTFLSTPGPPAASDIDLSRSLVPGGASAGPSSPPDAALATSPGSAGEGPGIRQSPAGNHPFASVSVAMHPPPPPAQPSETGRRAPLRQPDPWQMTSDAPRPAPNPSEQPMFAPPPSREHDSMFSALASAAMHAAPVSATPRPPSGQQLGTPALAHSNALLSLLQVLAAAPASSISQLAALGPLGLHQDASTPYLSAGLQPLGLNLPQQPQDSRNSLLDMLASGGEGQAGQHDPRTSNLLAFLGMANQCAEHHPAFPGHPNAGVPNLLTLGAGSAASLQQQLGQLAPDPAVAQMALTLALQLNNMSSSNMP